MEKITKDICDWIIDSDNEAMSGNPTMHKKNSLNEYVFVGYSLVDNFFIVEFYEDKEDTFDVKPDKTEVFHGVQIPELISFLNEKQSDSLEVLHKAVSAFVEVVREVLNNEEDR